MKNVLLISQIVTACVFATLILIQSRGGTNFSRRGLEKLLYKLTFVFAGLFILFSVISLAI